MAAEARNVLVAFIGLIIGALFLTLAMLDGQQYAALAAFAMTVFCGSEFVQRADFNALS